MRIETRWERSATFHTTGQLFIGKRAVQRIASKSRIVPSMRKMFMAVVVAG